MHGGVSVKAQCLPFTQIPHTTQLFADFLYDFPKVSRFYPRPPMYAAWLRDQSQTIQYDAGRRKQVAAVLARQNRGWGASEKALANLKRFKDGALAAVTGQQVGLFGGPLFTVFKVLSAVRLAEEASAQGIPAVPIFWLATADHDLAEVNHIFVTGAGGVERIATPTEGIAGAPVGSIRFGDEIVPVVDRMRQILGESEVTEWLRAAYCPGESFGSAFAKFYTRVFGELGVILIDPNDAELQALDGSIYSAAITRAAEVNEVLLQRGKELTKAGYHEQVKVTAASTTLFALHNGARTAIHRIREGFEIAGEKISGEVLQQRVAASPSEFSPNALLRPVVQDVLLPTLAYVGGPAEVAYFAQSAVLYEKLAGRVTPILQRFSATLVDAKQAGLLERYCLPMTDLFAGLDVVLRSVAARTLPAEVQTQFETAQRAVDDSMGGVRKSLEQLDSTLVDAADRAGRKIRYQLARLRQRAASAELRRNEVLTRHVGLLSDSLFPNKAPQERQLAAVQFLARYGNELLPKVLENVRPDCVDHQILFA